MGTGLYGRLACRLMLAASAAALTSACSSDPSPQSLTGVSRSVFTEDEYGVSSSPRSSSRAKGGGQFKLGQPYKVAGRWYVPRDNPHYDEYGVASWYGADFHGRRTANGEVFDANALTAAHTTLPLPCYAYVTNVDNGKTILVRVNDRGPYVNDRLIDMSYAAAKQLDFLQRGRARVRVRFAGLAPLNGDDRRERQFLASQLNRERDVAEADPPPASRGYASAEVQASRLPPDASDRWDPNAYRAALAGKPVPPPPAPARRAGAFVRTASLDDNTVASGRMALAAPNPQGYEPQGYETQSQGYEAPQRFAPASGAPDEQVSFETPSERQDSYAPQAARGYAPRTYVQVGLFRERSNAERLRRELGAVGPVEVSPMPAESGGQVYRVRVGPLAPADAGRTQSRIAAYGVTNTAIVTD
jgi:rare lipoprotein A